MRLVIDGELHDVRLSRQAKRKIITNILAWGLVGVMFWGLIQLAIRAI